MHPLKEKQSEEKESVKKLQQEVFSTSKGINLESYQFEPQNKKTQLMKISSIEESSEEFQHPAA